MAMTNNGEKVIMEVPANMVAQLQLFMQNMEMTNETNSAMEMSPIENEENNNKISQEINEVEKVLAHKCTISSGNLLYMKYKLLFKSGEIEWISEEDCNCEYLISNYLKEKKIKTSYVFCRVSTKEQATSTNLSLDAQKEEILSMINTESRVKIIQISSSAYKNIPKDLVEVGNNANAGDIIYVWRIDRLSRNIFNYMEWLEELNKREVLIYSVDEQIYYNMNRTKFLEAILDAQKEAELLSKRVKLANKRKRERGDQAIGSLPYGKIYKRIVDNSGNTLYKVVVENEEEMNIIKYIKSSKLAKHEIASTLNKRKSFKRQKKWNVGMIERILKCSC